MNKIIPKCVNCGRESIVWQHSGNCIICEPMTTERRFMDKIEYLHQGRKALQVLRVLHKNERREVIKEETEKQVKILINLFDEAYKNWREDENL